MRDHLQMVLGIAGLGLALVALALVVRGCESEQKTFARFNSRAGQVRHEFQVVQRRLDQQYTQTLQSLTPFGIPPTTTTPGG